MSGRSSEELAVGDCTQRQYCFWRRGGTAGLSSSVVRATPEALPGKPAVAPGDIGRELLMRILRQAGISREEWGKLG